MTNKQHLNSLLDSIAKYSGDVRTIEEAKDKGHERYLDLDENCGQFPGYRIVTIATNSGSTHSAFGYSDTSTRLKYKEMVLRLEGILAGLMAINKVMAEPKTKKLFDGTVIPGTINTDERIFQIETYSGDNVLCNLVTAKMIIKNGNCKRIKHYWDNKFTTIGKSEVKEISS